MKKYLKPNYLIFLITLILAVASIVVLLNNEVLHFAEFHDTYVVSVSSDDKHKSDVTDYINSFANTSNVSRIDRKENQVYFENTTLPDLDKKVKDSIKPSLTYTIALNVSPQSEAQILNNQILSLVVIGIVALGAFFVLILRFNPNIKLKQYLIIFLIYVLSFKFASLLQFGLLSFISMFYQVKILDLTSLYTMGLFLSGIFFISIYHYRTKEGVSVISIADTIIDEVKRYFLRSVYIALIILILVSFGLGINFVMPAILVSGSIIISMLSIYIVGSIFKINPSEVKALILSLKSRKFTNKKLKKVQSVKKKEVVKKNIENKPKKAKKVKGGKRVRKGKSKKK